MRQEGKQDTRLKESYMVPREGMHNRFKNLNAALILISEAVDLTANRLPEPIWIDVKGREEHESLLRDSDKMWSLGLDPSFEKMVYLKRWGSWLNGCTNFTGNL